MKYISCLLIFLISISSFANEQMIFLKKDDKALFQGYLISEEYEKKFRLTNEELIYEKNLNTSLSKINKLYEENLTILDSRILNQQKHIDNLNKTIQETDNSFFSKAAYFVLGALITGTIAYGIYKTK